MNKSTKLRKLIKITALGLIGLALTTQVFLFIAKTNMASEPLIIYIAENDHGDMSYGSLVEQVIKYCRNNDLSTKTFSEFSSQTAKSEKQKPRTSELMSLTNSRESVVETAKFLDGQFISIGNIEARSQMWNYTWKSLSKSTTPEQLVLLFESNVDNIELLKMMKDDLTTGKISGVDKIGNLENFYTYWRSPLHYKQIHEEMAKDLRDNLQTTGTPDVIIIIAGSPHLPGLNQQLRELKNSLKIVIGNFPQGLNPLNNYIYSGSRKVVGGVGKTVGFEVDLDKKEAVVPDLVKKMIDEKSKTKAKSQLQ